jgi:hypothetical protein
MKTAVILVAFFSLWGVVLLVGGVYILAGVGWAMIAAAVPLLVAAAVLIRGLANAS